MRRIVALGLVLAAAVTTATVLLTAASPASARERIVAAALAQQSVRWTERVVNARELDRVRSDVNADAGRQRMTISGGSNGGGEVSFLLVNDTVYVRGNMRGFRYAFSLATAQAKRYAAFTWISIPKSDELYAEAADGLTLASIVHDVAPLRELRSVRKTSHERRLLALLGSGPGGLAELSARTGGEPLPVAFSQVWAPASHGLTGSFSKWNEPVHVEAPARSTPIATVRKS